MNQVLVDIVQAGRVVGGGLFAPDALPRRGDDVSFISCGTLRRGEVLTQEVTRHVARTVFNANGLIPTKIIVK